MCDEQEFVVQMNSPDRRTVRLDLIPASSPPPPPIHLVHLPPSSPSPPLLLSHSSPPPPPPHLPACRLPPLHIQANGSPVRGTAPRVQRATVLPQRKPGRAAARWTRDDSGPCPRSPPRETCFPRPSPASAPAPPSGASVPAPPRPRRRVWRGE